MLIQESDSMPFSIIWCVYGESKQRIRVHRGVFWGKRVKRPGGRERMAFLSHMKERVLQVEKDVSVYSTVITVNNTCSIYLRVARRVDLENFHYEKKIGNDGDGC